MKLLPLLALFLVSCADTIKLYDGKTGHMLVDARMMSDRVNETLTAPGYSYHVDSAMHSPVYRENWHGFDKALAIAGSDALGIYSLGAGNAAIRGVGLVAPAVTGYRSTAPVATPAPVPAAIQGKH